MAGKKIKIELIGMHTDNKYVRLSDFTDQLIAFGEALKQTDLLVSKKTKPTVFYRIVGLSHSSPALVELEAIPLDPMEDNSDEVVDVFLKSMEGIIYREEAPDFFNDDTFDAYRALGKKLNKGISHLVVSSNGHKINITKELPNKIQIIQGPVEIVLGSISGKLEVINVHAGANEFRIYPIVGPKKIRCKFPSDLKKIAFSAIESYVTVFGKLKYKAHSRYPFAMDVEKIEVSPPEETLPTLSELRGIAPDLTGGISPEDFVRNLRDTDG